jgi:hypothetical protein
MIIMQNLVIIDFWSFLEQNNVFFNVVHRAVHLVLSDLSLPVLKRVSDLSFV